MKGRVLDVNERKTSKGRPIFDVNVQGEDNKTVKYQCWDEAIKDKSGKEIEFTVKESDNPAFPTPTLNLPKGDGNTFTKKPWVGGGQKQAYQDYTRDNTALMCSKDLIVSMMNNSDKKSRTPVEIAKATLSIYRMFSSELHPVTSEQVEKIFNKEVVDDSQIPF